jgi:preprotein translocase subunit SecB
MATKCSYLLYFSACYTIFTYIVSLFVCLQVKVKLGGLRGAYSLNHIEAEVGGLQVQGQPEHTVKHCLKFTSPQIIFYCWLFS